MRSRHGSKWGWILLGLVLLPFLGWLFLRHETVNEMYPVLDQLAAIHFADRWSAPEMVKIRELGPAAVPPLRRVLREQDRPTTRFLLWLKGKWPGITRVYSHLPDAARLAQRRSTACQVVQMLGPAAHAAAPDLVRVIAGQDALAVNAGVMALFAVGIDAATCDRLDESLEKGKTGFGRAAIVDALGSVKPPSPRTVNALTNALADSSAGVRQTAADTLGRLGEASPGVVRALQALRARPSDDLTAISCCVALCRLKIDQGAALTNVFEVLERVLNQPLPQPVMPGSGGQGLESSELVFMKGAELFQEAKLTEVQRARALGVLSTFCEKSGRIFVRMLLLPTMMEFGFDQGKSLAVCELGLHQEEAYYRLQAAQLLLSVAGKFPQAGIDGANWIADPDLGVRVYAAILHWQKHKDAKLVVPILVDALDRKKYQSFYYQQVLSVALRTLGELGGAATSARSAVAALTRDPNPEIANLATEVLGRLGR